MREREIDRDLFLSGSVEYFLSEHVVIIFTYFFQRLQRFHETQELQLKLI